VRPTPQERGRLSSGIQVYVRHFNAVGKAVFSDQELRKITAPFENRKITADELQEVRYRLTACYVNRGYINSGAVNSGSEGNPWRDSHARHRSPSQPG
jgi:hemolysin activation/secretion protein